MRPVSGEDFTLVLPLVNAAAMTLFLAHFAATLPDDVHAVMVVDGAGWHNLRWSHFVGQFGSAVKVYSVV